MNTRAKSILTMTASALTLFAVPTLASQAATAPAHASADTINAQLINTVNELSKTTSNLSEALLKIINTKENIQISSNPSDSPVIILQSADSVTTTFPINADKGIFISDEADIIQAASDSVWFLPAENQQGGRYMWVPDENVIDVKALINGEATATPKELNPSNDINLSELTYWRGDSIPMALPTKRLGRYDRKLYNWLIYPKGLWHIGLTANYGELNTEDMEILSIVNDIDLHGKIYSVKPSVSYFLRNNLCVGLRLAFTKGDMAVNSLKVDIDEDMSFNLHDIKYTSDSYAAAVFLQQYFGLSRRGRFAVFNEAELSVGTGNSHFIRPFDGELRDTRTKTQSLNINYSPGVSIMMMKNAAFNLSFGIFGFHLKNEKQWENGEESGSRFTSGINFRFNIFNINFGVSIII
ncbi:MAG: hypothetical protein K2K98_00110 [Muribaculaceae bacterium]|nr:hypothetical protein [Muribaculaceae bacterium]